jgi:hypothetical protein
LANKSITASLIWDRLGISVSGICAIHCLVVPVFISTLPLWSFANFLHNWLHPVFVLLLIPVVYFAARRSHFDRTITIILYGGLSFVVIGWLFGHYWLGFVFESTMTLLGSGMLIAGHWFNYSHHRVCSNKKHHHHPISEKD